MCLSYLLSVISVELFLWCRDLKIGTKFRLGALWASYLSLHGYDMINSYSNSYYLYDIGNI